MYSTKGGGVSHSPHKWNSVYNGYLQRAGGVSLSPRKWNFEYNRHFFLSPQAASDDALTVIFWGFSACQSSTQLCWAMLNTSLTTPTSGEGVRPWNKAKINVKKPLKWGFFFYWLTAKMVIMLLCSRCFSSMGMEKSNNIKSKKNSKIVQRTLYAHVHCISTHATHKFYEPKSL